MTIEKVGPGGVGNAYGRRTTNQPTKITSAKPKDIYQEYVNKNEQPSGGGGGGGSGSSGLSNRALPRLFGAGIGFGPGGSLGLGASFVTKIPAESEFNAVRMWVFSKEPLRSSSQWEFIVAPTDEWSNEGLLAQRPYNGGTEYNFYAQTPGNRGLATRQWGWRRGTWGAESDLGEQNKSGYLLPASRFRNKSTQTGNYYPGTTCIASDWVTCQSLPSKDGSGLHYLLAKVRKPAIANESRGFLASASADIRNDKWKLAATAGPGGTPLPWYRRHFLQSYASTTDAVNDLSQNLPTVPTEAAYFFRFEPVAFEFAFVKPVRMLVNLGDSISEGGGYQDYSWNSHVQQAAYTKSTPNAPFVAYNAGFSTTPSAGYPAQLEILIQNGARPTDVFFPNWSTNDDGDIGSPNSQYTFMLLKERILRTIELCRSIGAQPYVWTNYWYISGGSGRANFDAGMTELDVWTKTLCANGAAKLVDVRAGWNDATMRGADNVHPTQVGIDYMAALFLAAL